MSLNIMYGYRCNLTCKGCMSGSDQVTTRSYDPDLNITFRAIEAVRRIVDIDKQGNIALLGGEALLYWHDRIVPLIKHVRQFFPDECLNIFSNGVLAHRYADAILDLMDYYHANFIITPHFSPKQDSVMSRQWHDNVGSFLSHPRIVKIHDKHYHVKNNIKANIYLYDSPQWLSSYRILPNSSIKPWQTNDPENSMRYGCSSGSTCSALFENRLYKCGSLAMLPGLLKAKNQIDDHAWQKYLNYPFVDVFDVDQKKFSHYVDTYGRPISHCDMCSNQSSNMIKWLDRTHNDVFQNSISRKTMTENLLDLTTKQ